MTDEEIEKLATLLAWLAVQEVTSTTGVLQGELLSAASAIRQLMRERDEARDAMREHAIEAQSYLSQLLKLP